MKRNENLSTMHSGSAVTAEGYVSRAILVALVMLVFVHPVVAQVEAARQAIEREEYPRAVSILSDALANNPTADAYLYLGIAYRHMKEYQKAEDAFKEGSKRYPDDSRFLNELANLFLENNNVEAA